ncbi:hypothetical protein ACFPPD_15775 [Cohnella suwonensis]|uniref:Uncharacterized protein n=1 Tax=Cohnella suwonensis TaxID=696072 RepID=A0ABW0LZJ7_9BACL
MTKRQYDAIGTVINWALSSTTSLADKMGIVEFRFEGSGSYQGGDPATPQGYNSTKVSLKSIDFTGATTTCTGGKHDLDYATNGFVHAANFHTGKGLYGAMSVIYRNGDILGVFQRASTLPNKMESFDTVAPGTYKFVVGTHPMSGGYKALNLYVLGTTNRDCRPSSTKRRILPALRSRGLTPTVVILPNVDPKVA